MTAGEEPYPGPEEQPSVSLILEGREPSLRVTARHLRALDDAWVLAAFAASAQRSNSGANWYWLHNSSGVPRPPEHKIRRESPTAVEIAGMFRHTVDWSTAFGIFVYMVRNIPRIINLPGEIGLTRDVNQLQRARAQRELEAEQHALKRQRHEQAAELESWSVPRSAATEVAPNSPKGALAVSPEDFNDETFDLTSASDDQRRLYRRAQRVSAELTRADPKIIDAGGFRPWTPPG